jgi:flavin reductase (DIM6/NTAB) family NADH-FMN oxidoreductase RutF
MSSGLFTGKTSGRHENKFKMSGLTAADGKKVKTPHIEECLGFLECRVKDRLPYDGVTLFIAEVLHAEADDKFFDGTWISEKADTIHHLGGGYFAVTGKRFKTR